MKIKLERRWKTRKYESVIDNRRERERYKWLAIRMSFAPRREIFLARNRVFVLFVEYQFLGGTRLDLFFQQQDQIYRFSNLRILELLPIKKEKKKRKTWKPWYLSFSLPLFNFPPSFHELINISPIYSRIDIIGVEKRKEGNFYAYFFSFLPNQFYFRFYSIIG